MIIGLGFIICLYIEKLKIMNRKQLTTFATFVILDQNKLFVFSTRKKIVALQELEALPASVTQL